VARDALLGRVVAGVGEVELVAVRIADDHQTVAPAAVLDRDSPALQLRADRFENGDIEGGRSPSIGRTRDCLASIA
jgi:hypothetical protein